MQQDPVAAPEGSPRASDPRAGAALPALVHDRPAATLLVDLDQGLVVFANALAVDLAPGVTLPAPLEDWSRTAALKDIAPDARMLSASPGNGTPERLRAMMAPIAISTASQWPASISVRSHP